MWNFVRSSCTTRFWFNLRLLFIPLKPNNIRFDEVLLDIHLWASTFFDRPEWMHIADLVLETSGNERLQCSSYYSGGWQFKDDAFIYIQVAPSFDCHPPLKWCPNSVTDGAKTKHSTGAGIIEVNEKSTSISLHCLPGKFCLQFGDANWPLSRGNSVTIVWVLTQSAHEGARPGSPPPISVRTEKSA